MLVQADNFKPGPVLIEAETKGGLFKPEWKSFPINELLSHKENEPLE